MNGAKFQQQLLGLGVVETESGLEEMNVGELRKNCGGILKVLGRIEVKTVEDLSLKGEL
jgi:hypothetical protein